MWSFHEKGIIYRKRAIVILFTESVQIFLILYPSPNFLTTGVTTNFQVNVLSIWILQILWCLPRFLSFQRILWPDKFAILLWKFSICGQCCWFVCLLSLWLLLYGSATLLSTQFQKTTGLGVWNPKGRWYYQWHKRQTQSPRIFTISNQKVEWLLIRQKNQRGRKGCQPMKLKLSARDSVKLNFSQRELKLPRQDLTQLTDQARFESENSWRSCNW